MAVLESIFGALRLAPEQGGICQEPSFFFCMCRTEVMLKIGGSQVRLGITILRGIVQEQVRNICGCGLRIRRLR